MSERQGRRRPLPIPPPPARRRVLPPEEPEQGEPEIFNIEDVSEDIETIDSTSPELRYPRPDENSGLSQQPVDDFFDGINEQQCPPNPAPPPPGAERWVFDPCNRRPPFLPLHENVLEPEPFNEPLGERRFRSNYNNQSQSRTPPGPNLFHVFDEPRIPPNPPPPESEYWDFLRQNRQPLLPPEEPLFRRSSVSSYFDQLDAFIILNLSPEEGESLREIAVKWPIWPAEPPAPEKMYQTLKENGELQNASLTEFRAFSLLPQSPPSPEGVGRDLSQHNQLSPFSPQPGAAALNYHEAAPPSPRGRHPVAARLKRLGARVRDLIVGNACQPEPEVEAVSAQIQEHEAEQEHEQEQQHEPEQEHEPEQQHEPVQAHEPQQEYEPEQANEPEHRLEPELAHEPLLDSLPLSTVEPPDLWAQYDSMRNYTIVDTYPRYGRYSKVIELFSKQANKVRALKVFHSRTPNSQIEREISILKKIHGGPNLINLFALILNPETQKPSLVLEYITNTNFRELYPKFSSHDNKFYFFELFKGLEFLKRRGIMHRSIRARNILIDYPLKKLRIIDFSVATVYHTDPSYGTHSIRVFPPAMMAPELLVGFSRYDFAVDMWTAGLLMALSIFRTSCFPFCRHDYNQIVHITSLLGTDQLFAYLKKYNIEISPAWTDYLIKYHHPMRTFTSYITPYNQEFVSYEALDILSLILCYDHKRRMSAAKALQHPYFNDVRNGY